MKNNAILRISVILCTLIILSIRTASHGLFASDKIHISEIELPSVKSIQMNDGLKGYYIKDELPRMTISVSIAFGKLNETALNAGISDLLSKALLLSGSKKYPAQTLHDTVENIGGRFMIQSFWEDTVISIEVLERYSKLALDIIEDIVLNPDLNKNMVENARSLLLEEIRRKQDSPDALAFENVRKIIFNGDSYGATQSEETLKSITIKDLEQTITNYFCGENIIIGISGQKNFKDIENNFKQRFLTLRKGKKLDYSVNTDKLKSSIALNSKNIYLIPKELPQATIVLGTIAPDNKDKRIYSLTLMDYILGGGSFTSRLMHEIRVRRGLAYAVQSVIKFRKNTGVFIAFAQTNNESTYDTLSLLIKNIEIMTNSEVKDEELKLAKDSIKNSYIFEFATPADVLNQYTFLDYNGLPESFLTGYIGNIEKVTKKDIIENSSLLFKNGLIKVVVGKKELAEKLGKFGNVVILQE